MFVSGPRKTRNAWDILPVKEFPKFRESNPTIAWNWTGGHY